MATPQILEAATQTFGQGGYKYGDATKGQSRNGGVSSIDGLKQVDCSFVVGTALQRAGIVTGVGASSFNTSALFTGTALTDLAKERFDSLTSTQVKDGSSLKPGDLIEFIKTDPKSSTRHIGIFSNYDENGNPVFFGSQVSTGPAYATIDLADRKTTWNGKDFTIVGALRAKSDYYVPELDQTGAAGTGIGSPKVAALVNLLKTEGVEGYRPGIYATDGAGVPTLGNGNALLSFNKSTGQWSVLPSDNLKALFTTAGLDSSRVDQLPFPDLQRCADLLNKGDKAACAAIFGDGKNPGPNDFSVTTIEADRLTGAYVVRNVVPAVIKGMGDGDPSNYNQLSAGEFAAIGSRVYEKPGFLDSTDGAKFFNAWLNDDHTAAVAALTHDRSGRGALEAAAYNGSVNTNNEGLSAPASYTYSHDPYVSDYVSSGNINHNPDDSTTFVSNALKDASDGRFQKGDWIVSTYDKDSNATNLTILHSDTGRVTSTAYSSDGKTSTTSEWDKSGTLLNQNTFDRATGDPIGECVINGQRYHADGTPFATEGPAQPAPAVDPEQVRPQATEPPSQDEVAAGFQESTTGTPANPFLDSLVQSITNGTPIDWSKATQVADASDIIPADTVTDAAAPDPATLGTNQVDGASETSGATPVAFTSVPYTLPDGSTGTTLVAPNRPAILLSESGDKYTVDIDGQVTWLDPSLPGDGTLQNVAYQPGGDTNPSANLGTAPHPLTPYAQGLNSAISLIQALEHGQALPAILSGANLVNALNKIDGGSGNLIAGEFTAGLGFITALQSGDAGGIVTSGLQLADVLSRGDVSLAIANALGFEAAAAGNMIPGLGLALSLSNIDENPMGVVSAALMMNPTTAPFAIAFNIASSLFGGSLFGDDEAPPPPPAGAVHFQWNDEGHIVPVLDLDQSGGGGPALSIATQLAATLEAAVASFREAHPDIPASALPALNPNLIPRVGVRTESTGLVTWIETLGQDGTPFQALIGLDEFAAKALTALETNGGIAPQWQVDTVFAHWQDNGSLTEARAGSFEWQRMQIEGNAVESSSASQSFGALVLHLPDTAIVLGEALRDVEGDGFVERTEWLGASLDQALLVLDFNGNGLIDRTGEVLNLGGNGNAHAGIQRNNVDWLDVDGGGVLDASDPAFAAIRVWIDANGDGLNQSGELNSFAEMGITRIDFTTGEVLRSDGSVLSLTAHSFDAGTEGVRSVELTPGNALGLVVGAGTVLEHEGYQGQHVINDGNGARSVGVRETWIEQDALRIGDWEGTADAAAHRHGGGNVAGSPTETKATGAVSTGPVRDMNTTTRTTVTAGDARLVSAAGPQARSAGVAFVPLGGMSAQQELRDVTAEMIRSSDSGIFSSAGAAPLVGLGVGAAGLATVTFPTVASAAVVGTMAAANDAPADIVTSAPLVPGGYVMHADTAAAVGATAAAPAPVPDAVVVLPALAPLAPLAGAATGAGAPAAPAAAPTPVQDSGTVAVAPNVGVSAGAGSGSAAKTPSAPVASATTAAAAPSPATDETAPASAAPSAPPAPAALDHPVVHDEHLAGVEDTVLRWTAAQLLANDHSPNAGLSIHVSAVGAASHGTVTLGTDAQGNAEVVFVPDLDFHGEAGFEYTVTDDVGLSTTGAVRLDIAAVNDAPVTANEAVTTMEDTTIRFAAASLLANDSDVDTATDGQVLSIARVGQASHGTVMLGTNAQGNAEVSFLPEADFHGAAGYTYWVSDGAGGETAASVAVDVTAVNDAPVAVNDRLVAVEDTELVVDAATLLANDWDVDTATDGDVLAVVAVGAATHGTVSLAVDGRIHYLPDADYHGPAQFDYTVTDPFGALATATVSLNATSVNDLPTPQDDVVGTAEDAPLLIAQAQLLANDSDTETPTAQLRIVAADAAEHGTVTLLPSGAISFVAEADFFGTARFRTTVRDGDGGETQAWTSVQVAEVNDAPVTVGESASTAEDTAIVFAASALLANDSDVDTATVGDMLAISRVGNASHGSVALATIADGSVEVRFTPDADYFGAAEFTYWVGDGRGGETPATMALAVTPVNDAPVVPDIAAAAVEDTAVTLSRASLLANATDVDDAWADLAVARIVSSNHGQAALDANGGILFTPDANFHGTASVRYVVADGAGGETAATATLQVAAVNDAPVTVGESATTAEDTAIVFAASALLANDTDADIATDGDVIRVSRVANAQHGTAAIDGAGNVLFTPDANYHGSAGFNYWVADRAGVETVASAAISVTAVNDLPVAVGEQLDTQEDTVLLISPADLLANDSDVDTATDGQTPSITAVANAQHGSVQLVSGLIRFTPDAHFNGVARFDYTVSDGNGGTATATAAINLAAVNDAPVTVGETASGNEDNELLFTSATLLANDSDADIATNGDALRIARVGGASHGTVSLDAQGTVHFQPVHDYNGPAQFTYYVADSAGVETPATVNLTVAPVNDAPVVTGEAVNSQEDQALNFAQSLLLANDSDVDGGSLYVSAVGGASHGTVAFNADSSIRFTPDANYNGAASFTYTVADGAGGSTSGTVNLSIAAVNDAPVAVGEFFWGQEDLVVNFPASLLLANDSDVETPTSALSISRVGGASRCTVYQDGGGNVVFIPEANYNGDVQFTYWIRDASGAEAPATVTVNLGAINDTPVAQGETVYGASEDARFYIAPATLLANDYDIDGPGPLYVSWAANPVNGSVWRNADGTIVFEPTANFNGTARFDYRVTDGAGGDAALVTAWIPVAAVNDNPVAVDDRFQTTWNSQMSIGFAQLTGNDSDVDGDVLTVAAVGSAVNGSAWIENGVVRFNPTPGFSGAASFQYLANDGHGGQTWATAFVDVVIPPNLYPTLWTSQLSVTYYNPQYIYSMTSSVGVSDDGNPNAVTVSIIGARTLAYQGTTIAGYDEWGSPYYSAYGMVWNNTTPAAIGYSMNLPGGVFSATPGWGWVGALQLDWKLTDDRGLVNYAHFLVDVSLPGAIIDSWSFWNDHTGYAPPVVLDLDGDGYHFQSLATSNVRFDINGDGRAEKLAWTAPEDGIVVWDRNGDGRVTEAAEFSFANAAAGADTDLAGLRAFDSNGNDLLDAADTQWAAFGVWQDKNGNGVSDDGEYRSFADLGIASLRLQSNGQMTDTGSDAIVLGETVATRNDGSILAAADALLAFGAAPPDAAELARQALLFSQWAAAANTSAEPLGFATATLADQDVLAQLVAAQLDAAASGSATGVST